MDVGEAEGGWVIIRCATDEHGHVFWDRRLLRPYVPADMEDVG